MKKILSKILITLTLALGMSANAYALSPVPYNNVALAGVSTACSTLNQINPNEGCNNTSGFGNVIKAIVEILSIIVGIVAVIVIIVSGLRFITSGGDPQSASSARSSLIYAVIGLMIAALAQVIVHLVLNTANGNTPH